MQEAAFRAIGWKAFYLAFELKRQAFLRVMRERTRLLFDGFNVTVPYKELMLRYLDRVDPEARAIGAVNTVIRQGKQWMGFNTDSRGFLASLEREAKFRARGKRILVLGAGGSARAVVYALAKRGASRIVIVNRTRARAERIVSEYRRLFSAVELVGAPLAGALKTLKNVDLVVNATPIGLRPNDPSLVRAGGFPRKTLFFDLIYQPAETELLREARRSGHRTVNGRGMLLYQGAEAFGLWTGRKAPLEVMRRALQKEALRKERADGH